MFESSHLEGHSHPFKLWGMGCSGYAAATVTRSCPILFMNSFSNELNRLHNKLQGQEKRLAGLRKRVRELNTETAMLCHRVTELEKSVGNFGLWLVLTLVTVLILSGFFIFDWWLPRHN